MITIRIRHGNAPLTLLPIVVALALISSCSPGTDPGPCETFECREISYLLTATRMIDRSLPDSAGDRLWLTAGFFPDDPTHGSRSYFGGVYAGQVTFNGKPLTSQVVDPGGLGEGILYGLQGRADSLLAPSGSVDTWVVSGFNDEVPEFTVALPRLPPVLRLEDFVSAPNDTIDENFDLLLQWNSVTTTDSTFVFLSAYGEGKDGSLRYLSELTPHIDGDTLRSNSYLMRSDSLQSRRNHLTSITFILERETIRDILLPNGRWARLLYRESLNRILYFRP